jgi:hypothetical protein
MLQLNETKKNTIGVKSVIFRLKEQYTKKSLDHFCLLKR